MHEPPANLHDDTLRAVLRAAYGVEAATLTFLPLGYDASAWVYRVRAAGNTEYFLKVRSGAVNEPGLLVPRFLHDQGITSVIAPLSARSGAPCTAAAGYTLVLYPFVAGQSGMKRGLSDQQWLAYGTLLRQIHDTAPPAGITRVMRREDYTPAGAAPIRALDARIGAHNFDDPVQDTLAAFWRTHRAEIHTLVERAEDLGRRLARRGPAHVLCHADIHTGNVLVDTAGQIWIVDWDETMLAPRERDLMFVVGGGISRTLVRPREEELFLQGYGAVTPDPLALAYYRYAWAVSDIGAFGEEVFFRPDLGPISRCTACDSFMGLFLPGNIVALAFAAPIAPL